MLPLPRPPGDAKRYAPLARSSHFTILRLTFAVYKGYPFVNSVTQSMRHVDTVGPVHFKDNCALFVRCISFKKNSSATVTTEVEERLSVQCE